jgi:hypothetical protein
MICGRQDGKSLLTPDEERILLLKRFEIRNDLCKNETLRHEEDNV